MTPKEQIQSIVNQLERDNSYKSMNIDDLLNAQTKLSLLGIYLSESLATLRLEAKNSVFKRRSTVTKKYLSKKANKIQDRQITDKLAEMQALDESDDVYLDEIKKESEFESLEQYLRQVNILISSLTMRISNLKSERMTATQNLLTQ